jgi:hypothetical protein
MSATQPSLFPVNETQPRKCTARGCGTTRPSLCRHDADLAHDLTPGKRPRGCLNAYDPSKARIPY